MSQHDDSKIDAGTGWTYERLDFDGSELIVEEDEIIRETGDHWDPSNWHRWMDEPFVAMLKL